MLSEKDQARLENVRDKLAMLSETCDTIAEGGVYDRLEASWFWGVRVICDEAIVLLLDLDETSPMSPLYKEKKAPEEPTAHETSEA